MKNSPGSQGVNCWYLEKFFCPHGLGFRGGDTAYTAAARAESQERTGPPSLYPSPFTLGVGFRFILGVPPPPYCSAVEQGNNREERWRTAASQGGGALHTHCMSMQNQYGLCRVLCSYQTGK